MDYLYYHYIKNYNFISNKLIKFHFKQNKAINNKTSTPWETLPPKTHERRKEISYSYFMKRAFKVITARKEGGDDLESLE